MFTDEWFHVLTLPESVWKRGWTKEAFSFWPFILHHAPPLTKMAQTFQSVSSRALAIHWICNILINVVCFEANFTQKGVILYFLHRKNGRKHHLPTQQAVTWRNTECIFHWIFRTSHPSRPEPPHFLSPLCSGTLYYHYVSALYPSRLHKALFLLPAHSFFSGLGLLIKMLNATLEVTNTKFCCLTFSFSRYAALREPDALMNGWCNIQGDRLLWEN